MEISPSDTSKKRKNLTEDQEDKGEEDIESSVPFQSHPSSQSHAHLPIQEPLKSYESPKKRISHPIQSPTKKIKKSDKEMMKSKNHDTKGNITNFFKPINSK